MIQLIPAADLNDVVQKVFGTALAKRGFEQIDPRRWVRSKKPLIREVVLLCTMKGLSLSPIWGFSLDFVPHVSAGRIRWHRTSKSASMDLSYDPFDYEGKPLTISRFQSADAVREGAKVVLEDVLWRSGEFFESVRTIPDLVDAFEAKRNRPAVRFGFENYVQHPMAYAFVLAKLGRERAARKWLEVAKKYHELDDIELTKLKRAFDDALRESKPSK